jgi:hypothetical protein
MLGICARTHKKIRGTSPIFTLRVFSDERITAVNGYRRLKAEGIGAASPWQGLKGQIDLGSDQFAKRMQARIDPTRPLREVPKRQRRALAKRLARRCRSLAGPRSRDGRGLPHGRLQYARHCRLLRRQ